MKMPENMKLASIWVVWAFLAIGALGWALFVVLEYFGIEDRSGWVQAIGSVLAIVGAAAFPYKHEADRRRARRKELALLMYRLADDQAGMLGALRHVVTESLQDFGEYSINEYLRAGLHLRWPPHVEALRAIPVSEVNPYLVRILGELKVGANFATQVIDRLSEQNDEWTRNDIELLAHYERLLKKAYLDVLRP